MSEPTSVWMLRESDGSWSFSFDEPTAKGAAHYSRKGRMAVEMIPAARLARLERVAEAAERLVNSLDCNASTDTTFGGEWGVQAETDLRAALEEAREA